MKPLLIGELNPYGADPAFALYPSPDGSAGHRLATLVLGLPRAEYLRLFDRANLCTGKWAIGEARDAVDRIFTSRPGGTLVLLGAKVAQAFGYPFEPFTQARIRSLITDLGRVVVQLPHPSGRCRLWNEPGAFERARALLREAGALP